MKQLLLFLICNLAFLLTVQGNSAEIPPAVMFKQLSTTEGLSNNSVRSIYRDNRGFLWVGTESGLNKYDGYSFQQYYQNNSDLPDGSTDPHKSLRWAYPYVGNRKISKRHRPKGTAPFPLLRMPLNRR